MYVSGYVSEYVGSPLNLWTHEPLKLALRCYFWALEQDTGNGRKVP